jgi:hypothetical protein
MLNQLCDAPYGHVVEVERFLCIFDAAVLQMGGGEGKHGICDGGVRAGEREDQLLERVACLLAEDDEMRQHVAEVIDESPPVPAVREFGEYRRIEVPERRADRARGDHGEVWI